MRKKQEYHIPVFCICLFCLCALTACGDGREEDTATVSAAESQEDSETGDTAEASREIFAMDTYMEVVAYGEQADAAAEAAAEEIERLDALLSTGDEDSEVYQINSEGGGELSDDTAYLIERSLELCDSTGGAFDIAIYPMMEAWGFPDEDYTVPSEEEIESLLPLTDVSQIFYDEEAQAVEFGLDGMEIDFGGIAKGYTSARIIDIYREYGIESGIVNLGGNVQVLGTKTDGSLWRIGVQNPENEEEYLGVLEVSDKAVVTSGGYERYFEEDGNVYHHIIDPATGYPADSGLISVTIVCSDGVMADGLSTSLFIMGLDSAADFWREHSGEFDAILETDDGTLYITEGIAECFSSDMEVEIIEE